MLGIDFAAYVTYVLACIAIVLAPGPTLTVIVANSLRHGPRAGMLVVAGTQVGLLLLLAILAAGLEVVVRQAAWVFEIVRLAGAAYLIWLGIKLWRSGGFNPAEGDGSDAPKTHSLVWQGALVLLSNPKALLLFGALIPQFIAPGGGALAQTLFLGVTFMVIATISDGVYALAAGGLGKWLTTSLPKLLERISGTFLIAGGVWLAFSKRQS